MSTSTFFSCVSSPRRDWHTIHQLHYEYVVFYIEISIVLKTKNIDEQNKNISLNDKNKNSSIKNGLLILWSGLLLLVLVDSLLPF